MNLLLIARDETIMSVRDENSLKRTFWHNRRRKNQKDNSHTLSLIQVKLYETVWK